ncbi:tetratricopeptide repeat protein [Lysinibacillus capsici]|uniref:tetratricopeptide repeat protein n=1 Tax=Lysinibacillus capsici TaxID=2115968 RepID=UPI003D07B617
MTFTESTRKYILSGIVALVIIGLILASVLADKQDEEFMMSESLYNQAVQLQANGDLEDAELMISEVLKKHPHSEVANYVAGLTIAQNDDIKKAAIYMQKVLDINPHKVEDPRFMIQLGEIFVGAEKYEEAKIVLLRCQESQWTLEDFPNYQEHISTLLAQIENL